MGNTSPEAIEPGQPQPAPVAASPVDAHASPVAERRGRSRKATASLALGIVAVLVSPIPVLAWVHGSVAIGVGRAARDQIREHGLSGSSQATTGRTLGVVAVVRGFGYFVLNALIS